MTLGAQFGYPGVPGPGKIVQVAPQPATIRVGAGGQFPVPSAAAAAARDGDVIEILAGDYSGDVAIWRQHNLIIRGVGGRAHLKAEGKHAEGKAIWVIKGTNATIENIEFSGAKVPSRNGAGIRQEGAGVLIRGCYFHDNENGILAGKNPLSDVVIENSEFAFNGYGDGQTHNMYIGQVRSFTLRYSYSHHAKIGHNVKSRALVNYILYNRIMDEDTGESSYAIDLPNGGLTFIIGNLIQQGPRTQNRTIVSYGKEGLQNPASAFYLINNTIVNDHMEGKFVAIQAGTTIARLMNNIFSGPGTILTGPGEEVNNLISEKSGFVNAAEFDYHLTRNSPAIDAGTNPGSAHDFGLQPVNQYVHTAKGQKRVAIKTVDMGAYEYHGER
ncbi:MAG: right-handed parallel beta-helix repeat-containing protein [bacterium]